MKVHARPTTGCCDAHQQGARPGRRAHGEYIGADADRAGGGRRRSPTRSRRPGERDPQLYYEDGFQEYADRGGRVGVAPIGAVEWVEVDDHADLDARAGGRVPLLTRMVGAPLAIDIGPGAVAGLAPLLADRRISSGGHVAVVGRARAGRGDRRGAAPAARQRRRSGRSRAARVEAAHGAARRACARASTTRVVGIGGGRTLDVAKHAAALSGLPMVAVATSLAHDGIASPVAVAGGGRAQGAPTACRCRSRSWSTSTTCAASEPAMRRSGIGDVVSQPVGDRRLAAGRARARRAGRRPRGDVRPHRRHRRSCTARTGSTTTTS